MCHSSMDRSPSTVGVWVWHDGVGVGGEGMCVRMYLCV